jgi:hypothetical protein
MSGYVMPEPKDCQHEHRRLRWSCDNCGAEWSADAVPDAERLRELSARATPGRWYVDGPEFGGVWVVTGGEPPKDSFAVHPSAKGQPYAVLGGMGEEDANFIVAAVNHVRAALATPTEEER